MDIGKKIKRLRTSNQLTQEELANRCELSKGFISQVENNLTSPSIATLVDILEVLGTNLNEFFSENQIEKVCYNSDDMFETYDEERKYNLLWLVPNSQNNNMEPVIVTLEPGGSYPQDKPHDGEEFGYVLEGTIQLHLGSEIYSVKRSESFYYKANLNHCISNVGKVNAKIIWVSSPPSF